MEVGESKFTPQTPSSDKEARILLGSDTANDNLPSAMLHEAAISRLSCFLHFPDEGRPRQHEDDIRASE